MEELAEPLGTVAPPTDEQLTLLRTDIEPEGRVINVGKWIAYKPKDEKE